MKTAIAAIICVSIGIGISYAFIENNKPVKREPIQKVEIEWWHQFLGPHTVEEIVDAAYEASRAYRYNHCEEVKVWNGSRQKRLYVHSTDMTPLVKDFYYRIFRLGDTETQKCIISKDPSKYLL